MALPYWIEEANGTRYVWFKIDQAAGTKKNYTIKKDINYTPELPQNFFSFFDHFEGSDLDSNTWTSNNTNYSVSNSKLNMWNNWGGCCNGGCYYDGVHSNASYDLPIRVRMAGNQDPYELTGGCGRTGITICYGTSEEVITSTDSSNQQGINFRIGNTTITSSDVKAIPNIAPANFAYTVNFNSSGIDIYDYWEIGRVLSVSGTPTTTTGEQLVISGDTDTTTYIDHLDYIAVMETREKLPTVSIVQTGTDYIVVEVDDTGTGNTVNFSQFIVCVQTDFVTSIDEGLSIYPSDVTLLIAKPDNTVWYLDGTNTWQQLANDTTSLTESDFSTYGMICPVAITKSKLEELTTTPRLLYQNSNAADIKATLKIWPLSRAIVQSKALALTDYTAVNSINIVTTGAGEIKVLISRDGSTWYKWDDANSQFATVGTRTLDYSNDADRDWIYNNGTDYNLYSNAGATDWYSFFGNTQPDQIYFAMTINYTSATDNIALDKIIFNVNTKAYYIDVTADQTINFTDSTISIQFTTAGNFIINYQD